MKTRRFYQTPKVLKKVCLLVEEDLLVGSIADSSVEIVSDGQAVTDINASSFGEGGFEWNNNWTWEN